MARHTSSSVYNGIQESPKQERFLKCLEICGSIVVAARWAKITRGAHYNWLDRDKAYPDRFRAALRRSTATLADEAVRRGYEGIRKAVRYKGRVVGYETEYSDSLLMRMIEAREPETYAPRMKQEHTGKDGAPLVDVAVLRDWIRGAPADE